MRYLYSLTFALAALAAVAAPAKKPAKDSNAVKWELKLMEDFKGTKLNEKLWTRIDKGNPDWMKKMSLRPDLVTVKDGQLHCWGKKNDDLASDPRTHLTGGVSTRGKFAMKYGKVEFKMKPDNGHGGKTFSEFSYPETRKKK